MKEKHAVSFKYPKRRTIDFGPYSPSSKEQPQARYGLPSDILFCSGCGVSNQRPSSAEDMLRTLPMYADNARADLKTAEWAQARAVTLPSGVRAAGAAGAA